MKANLATRTIPGVLLPVILCSNILSLGAAPLQTGRAYHDTVFVQEYHHAHRMPDEPGAQNVRSIAVDSNMNIWAATVAGVFMKPPAANNWKPIITGPSRGPSYSVAVDNKATVWLGTWDGVYSYRSRQLQKHDVIISPVSFVVTAREGVYCLGPGGIWFYNNRIWKRLELKIAKSVRDAVSDGAGGLWVATDIGLYHISDARTELFQTESELISSYLKAVCLKDSVQLWAGGLGGVTVRDPQGVIRRITPMQGLPSAFVNSIAASNDGIMWVGTDRGVVRYGTGKRSSLLFSRRWLLDDKVNDIAFDRDNNAWLATAGGVSAIKRKKMTLASKADYFYNVLMKRHIREPWIAGHCRLSAPGDTNSWQPMDDDNDGEYTSIYLAMESLRYAVTGNTDARDKASKAFAFLRYLQNVTGTEGFFARTIVPAEWSSVHDPNRTYDQKQLAEAKVRDPRYKPVEQRWHPSADGKWLWKGDTSSDEMCGHMMGYFYYYEFAADEEEKLKISKHVQRILDYLIANNYNFVDIDGTSTRWAVWSPNKLNDDPDWAPEKALNSFELLSFLKLGYRICGKQKYQDEYLRLIHQENYLDNIKALNRKNPAWYIYFDVSMAGYLFPILLNYETDPELRAVYEELIDEWFEKQVPDQSPLNNFIYCFARGKHEQIGPSIRFLIDTPLDLVDWHIDHRSREDIDIVRRPTLEELQTDRLVPPAIRATVRWDRNPWAAVNGNPYIEREPVFWLFPYWLGRYLGIIVN